jgi:hypothetical protein
VLSNDITFARIQETDYRGGQRCLKGADMELAEDGRTDFS